MLAAGVGLPPPAFVKVRARACNLACVRTQGKAPKKSRGYDVVKDEKGHIWDIREGIKQQTELLSSNIDDFAFFKSVDGV